MNTTETEATTFLDGKIARARVLVLRSALRLELAGMKRRGRSAYSIVKTEFEMRGSRQSVYEQLSRWIEVNIWRAEQ